jgi:metal-responsive CopG/Arc/MetJ family transcriptional regulator
MIRTQIQLTEEQARELKSVAQRRNVSMAELIRQAVETILEEDDDRWGRASAVVGRYHSASTDVSTHHDDYLAQDYR